MAYTFAASSNYLTAGSFPLTDLTTGATMSCVCRAPSATAYARLMSIVDTSTPFSNIGLQIYNNNFEAFSNSGSTTPLSTKGTFSANTWTLAGGTWSTGGAPTAWLNGVAGSASTTVTVSSLNDVNIGRTHWNGNAYLGATFDIAHAAIWNVPLSSQEMLELYNGGIFMDPRLVRPDALVACYLFIPDLQNVDWWRNANLAAGSNPSATNQGPPTIVSSDLWMPYGFATGAPAALDCEIAQTLPKLGQSVTTDVDVSASIAQALPKLTQSATADVDVSASAAQALPKLTQSATADVDVSASAAQTLPLLAQSVAAAVEVAAQINQTLPKLAQDGQLSTVSGFIGAQTLPKISQSATADVDVSAAVAQALPKLGQSASVDVDVSSTISQTLPKLVQSGQLSQPSGFVGAQTLPKLTQSVTADVDLSTAVAQTLPKLQQRAQVGETQTAAARTFIVQPRTSTFIVT